MIDYMLAASLLTPDGVELYSTNRFDYEALTVRGAPKPDQAACDQAWAEFVAAEQAKQSALDSARAANATPVNLADYSGEAAHIQQLAQKIAWLEQETAALGGG
jgi:hypothetical protein